MARQESAAAGRDGSAADVVIVGESHLPVAVMRQQQSPWLAVDDEDDDDDKEDDELGAQEKRVAVPQGHRPRRGRGRLGSRDESEDPATAMSVVSEQLWGLQQKLVGTYVAVARDRLGRAFPSPSLAAATETVSRASSRNDKQERWPSAGIGGGDGSVGGGSRKNIAERGNVMASGGGGGSYEDGIGVETSAELVLGALDSLRTAWEHLAEATDTLDRRAAAVLACTEAAAEVGGGCEEPIDDNPSMDDTGAASPRRDVVVLDHTGRRDYGARSNVKGGSNTDFKQGKRAGGLEERAEDLGPLWKGSLSEALARSGGGGGAGAGGNGIGVHGGAATYAVGEAGVDNAAGAVGATKSLEKDDAMGSLAWNNSARRQLGARRAELFELCGDVAHACVLLRAGVAGAEVAVTVADRGAGEMFTGGTKALKDMPDRLQELLSSADPPLTLKDLDVCQHLHGRVWEALNERKDRGARRRTNMESRGCDRSEGMVGGRTDASPSSSGATATLQVVSDREEDGVLAGCGDGGGSGTSSVDPRPLAETCVHALAKAGHIPADATAWSLCLAAEACYGRALLDLARVNALRLDPTVAVAASAGDRRRGGDWHNNGEAASGGSSDERARVRKKLGDASNELGKLMSQCAGKLVQAPQLPPPPLSPEPDAESASSSKAKRSPSLTVHPGLGCAVCVACAERWFRRSREEFKAIGDARNTALLLCNLASVERLKPRALARLAEACPSLASGATAAGNSSGSGSRRGGGKDEGLTSLRGAAAAVELCGEAHAALGRREADERTWDHASGELAMAYLCLGVERRQQLLAMLPHPDANSGAPEPAGTKTGLSTKAFAVLTSSAPSVAQARSVVEPLERALQIYTDMQNASQAAACHYQIGQYYAKVLPTYVGQGSARGSSCSPCGGGGISGVGTGNNNNNASGIDAALASKGAKAWEVGQRGARHFLAARAYFAPFENGPTSVILACSLCDLYLYLSNMGTASGSDTATAGAAARDSPSSSDVGEEGANVVVPVPAPLGKIGGGVGAGGDAGSTAGGSRLRPAAAVRLQCLEGALRSLLDTRSVFADAGVDTTLAVAASGVVGTAGAAGTTAAAGTCKRLRSLLESVTKRLPKVMQALVRASMEMEEAPIPATDTFAAAGGSDRPRTTASSVRGSKSTTGCRNQQGTGGGEGGGGRGSAWGGSSDNRPSGPWAKGGQQHKRSEAFKSMYRRSLMGMRGGGEGAQAMLAGLAAEYGTVERGEGAGEEQ